MADSQESAMYTQPPMDITTEMMSPTTTALLANMNVSITSAARGGNNADASLGSHGPDRSHDSFNSATHAPARRPLGDVMNGNGAAADGGKRKPSYKRVMGPHEANYRQNYDSFVAKTIARYSARTQTNLRHDTLPNYHRMTVQERTAAMRDVDALLERLSAVDIDAPIEEGAWHTQSTTGSDGSSGRQHETVGSATTLGEERHEETFGSATTLGGGGEEHDGTLGSATTPGEGYGGTNRQSTGSATTLGNNKSLAADETTILEESMILLSDDEIGGTNNDEDSRFSAGEDEGGAAGMPRPRSKQGSPGAAPIERTRHYHHPHHSTLLALDDEMLESTPPLSNNRHPSKRCASNSGKRGLKSRPRGSSNDGDDSLLGHFGGIGDDENGMFLHDQEDAFSCGSPIQRRFSHDGLESDCDDEMGDSVHDLPDRPPRGRGDDHNGNDSEVESRFSYQENDDVDFGGCNDYGDDDFGDDEGASAGNWNLSERPGTQNPASQWSTFRNADAEFTASQMNGEDEDDSPVRRRAIQFERAKSQRQSQRSNDSNGSKEKAAGTAAQSSKKGTKDEDDPIQTVRNLCRRAKSTEDQGGDSLEEVAPIDVRLRDGMHFRMDPLRCKQNKEKTSSKHKTAKKKTKSVSIVQPRGKGGGSSDSENSLSDPEPSFKDPITDFPSRVAQRLNAGLSFLLEKEGRPQREDDEADGHSSAALLSMTARQIVCVTSKLLIQTKKSARMHQRSQNKPTSAKRFTPSSSAPRKEDDYLAGGTLIVLRGKEDVEQWEVGLREFTSLSVMNHAGMQSSLRKHASTAGKCSGFDVILTTYDAIKAKEVVVPVDSSGCAILGGTSRSNDEDGWFTSRDSGTQSGAAAPQKCHQLSVLHRMSWFRVVFMDVLGRKGFLTKPGTARAQAAVAINAKSRFAFFEKDEAAKKAEAKFKDDRRQLRSIITALHLPERMKLDKLIGGYILDVDKAGKGKETSDRDDSSSSEEYLSEEDEENLTEPW